MESEINRIQRMIKSSIDFKQQLLGNTSLLNQVHKSAQLITQTIREGNKVFVIGVNNKRTFSIDAPKHLFCFPYNEKECKKGDVIVFFSTFEVLTNRVFSLKKAKKSGAFIIGFIGEDEKEINKLSHICISIPSKIKMRIEETYHLIWAIICKIIEDNQLKGND